MSPSIVDQLASILVDAINADLNGEGYAQILDVEMPKGGKATLVVAAGDMHDMFSRFIKENVPDAEMTTL